MCYVSYSCPSRGVTGLSIQNTLSDHRHSTTCTFFSDTMNCHDILYFHCPQRMKFTSALPWLFLRHHHEVNICELILIADTFPPNLVHSCSPQRELLYQAQHLMPQPLSPPTLECSQQLVGFKVGQCLSNRHMTLSTVKLKHHDGR